MGTVPQTSRQVQNLILDVVECALEEVGPPCLSVGSGVEKENLAFSEALEQKLELVDNPSVRSILEGIITSIRCAVEMAKN